MSPTFEMLDDFDRPDGPLGPDWLDFDPPPPPGMMIESGSVVPAFFFNGAAYIPGTTGGMALNINNPGTPQVRLGAAIGDIATIEGGVAGNPYIWPGYYATWGSSVCTILQIEADVEPPNSDDHPVSKQTVLASDTIGVPVGDVQLAIFVDGDLIIAYIDGVPVLSATGLGGLGIARPGGAGIAGAPLDDPPHVAFFLDDASAASAGYYMEPPAVIGMISLNHALANTLFDGPPGVPRTPGISLNSRLLDVP